MFASASSASASSSFASSVPSYSSTNVPMAPFMDRSSRPVLFNEHENPLSNPLVQRLFTSSVPSSSVHGSMAAPMAPFMDRSSRPVLFNEHENPLSNPIVQRLFTAGTQVPDAPFLDRTARTHARPDILFQIPHMLTQDEIEFITTELFFDDNDDARMSDDNLFITPTRRHEHLCNSDRPHRSPAVGGGGSITINARFSLPFPIM